MATAKKKSTVEEVVEQIDEALDNLIAIADDLNVTLDLDPVIDTNLNEDDLLAAIKLQAEEVIPTDNPAVPPAKNKKGKALPQLQPETWAFLEANNFLGHLEPKKKEEPKKEAKKPAPAAKEAQKKGGFVKKPEGELTVFTLTEGADISARKGGMRLTLEALAKLGKAHVNALLVEVIKSDSTYKNGDIRADLARGVASGLVEKC